MDTDCFTLAFPSQIALTALTRPANSDRIFRAPAYHILSDVFKQFSNIPPVPNDVLIWSARLLDCHAPSYQDMIYSISTPFLSLKARSICLSQDLTSEARNQAPLKPYCSFLIDGSEPQDLHTALLVFFESFKTPTEDNGYSIGSLESNLAALKKELDLLPTTQLVLSLLLSHIDVLSSNTSQDLAEFTTWMNSKIMELKMEEVVPTLVSRCRGLQEAVNAAIPEVRHTSLKWKLLNANDIISLSAATAISASKLPTSYWTPLRLLMTSNEQYPHPCLPQVLDKISTISSYSSWTHPSMTGRQTVMINLNVMVPLLDDTRPTSSVFEDLKPHTQNPDVPFTLDFNCSYNIVNRDWLLHLCRVTGTCIDVMPFNGFTRPVTLADPAMCFSNIAEDLCHLFVQMLDSREIVEMEFFVMDNVYNTISGHTQYGIRMAIDLYKDPPSGARSQSLSINSTDTPNKRRKTKLPPPSLLDATCIAPINRSKVPPLPPAPVGPSTIRHRLLPISESFSRLHISHALVRSPAYLSICSWTTDGLSHQDHPFHFDNASMFPVMPETMVTQLELYTYVYAEGIELCLGYNGRRYMAHKVCYLYIMLPGDDVIRITPFLVTDNPMVPNILMPVHIAPLHIVQDYLGTVIPRNSSDQRAISMENHKHLLVDFGILLAPVARGEPNPTDKEMTPGTTPSKDCTESMVPGNNVVPWVSIVIGNHTFAAAGDTQAAVNIIHPRVLEFLSDHTEITLPVRHCDDRLINAEGQLIHIDQEVTLPFILPEVSGASFEMRFLIMEMPHDVILSNDTMGVTGLGSHLFDAKRAPFTTALASQELRKSIEEKLDPEPTGFNNMNETIFTNNTVPCVATCLNVANVFKTNGNDNNNKKFSVYLGSSFNFLDNESEIKYNTVDDIVNSIDYRTLRVHDETVSPIIPVSVIQPTRQLRSKSRLTIQKKRKHYRLRHRDTYLAYRRRYRAKYERSMKVNRIIALLYVQSLSHSSITTNSIVTLPSITPHHLIRRVVPFLFSLLSLVTSWFLTPTTLKFSISLPKLQTPTPTRRKYQPISPVTKLSLKNYKKHMNKQVALLLMLGAQTKTLAAQQPHVNKTPKNEIVIGDHTFTAAGDTQAGVNVIHPRVLEFLGEHTEIPLPVYNCDYRLIIADERVIHIDT